MLPTLDKNVACSVPNSSSRSSCLSGLGAQGHGVCVIVFPNNCRVKMVPDSIYGQKKIFAMFLWSSIFFSKATKCLNSG